MLGRNSICLFLIGLAAVAFGESEVRRTSTHREADAIRALTEQREFDRAIAWCEDRLAVSLPRSESHAWWSCTLAKVTAERNKQDGAFPSADAEEICRPLIDLLSQYPNHSQAIFVRVTTESIRLQSVASEVVQAAIETRDEERVDRMLRLLISLDRRVEDLINEATATTGVGDQEQVIAELSLIRLQAAMLRTELFPEGSRDFIGSSAKSISLIEDIRSALPSASPSRLEADLLHCQALLRGRFLDQATTALQRIRGALRDGSASESSELRWRALLIELHLLQDDLNSAKRRLGAHFGPSPDRAPLSLPMDLARLRYLIQSAKQATSSQQSTLTSQASAWIDSIGRRHDAYARRRAEAMLLATIGRKSDNNNLSTDSPPNGPDSVNAALLAMRGQQSIRDGAMKEGAAQLTAAASAETSPAKAIDIALKAAAAWRQVTEPQRAVKVMTETASRHPSDSRAAALHLQAAVIATREATPPWSADQLIAHLQSGVVKWQNDHASVRASKAWAVKTLTTLKKVEAATKVLAWTPPETWTLADVEDCVDTWLGLLITAEDDAQHKRFSEWLALTLASEQVPHPAAFPLMKAAVLGLDRSDLRQSRALVDASLARIPIDEQSNILNDLIAFRIGDGTAMRSPLPNRWEEVAEWRLMKDGRDNVEMRYRVSAAIETWLPGNDPNIESIERLAWQGKHDEAKEMTRQVLANSNDRTGDLKRLATRTAGSRDQADQKFALGLWDELAGGVKQSSPDWHEAKLSAASLLIQLGQRDEAIRRLKYVLLTQPPKTEELQTRYRSLVGSAGASATGPTE